MAVEINDDVAEALLKLAQGRVASVNEAINQLTNQKNEIDLRINQLREEVVIGTKAIQELSDALIPF